jgi:hypothetical protein
MPLINVKVIESVFTPEQKPQIAERPGHRYSPPHPFR